MAERIVVDTSVLLTADRRLFERTRTLPRVRHLSRVGALP
jgi:hypothetical protein